MESLAQIYERHRVHGPDVGMGDKGGTHSYIGEYEQLLMPYRNGCTFMEIGLAMGLSLAMWREYFGNGSILYGVDQKIVFDRAPHANLRTFLIECDATKPELLDNIGDRTFDVVIDDASHLTDDQVATFQLLRPRMNKGGTYIVEDILNLEHTVKEFKKVHPGPEVRDLRSVKGRFDDALLIFHF